MHQAGRERLVLRRIAPHLARPLGFVFPSYRGDGWPLLPLRAGVVMYDWLCGNRGAERSRVLSEDQTRALLPGIRALGLVGAARYFDGMTNDARLVIDTLRSAVGMGAVAVNHARFMGAKKEAGRWVCRVNDTAAGREREVEASVIVNAAGPWASELPGSGGELAADQGGAPGDRARAAADPQRRWVMSAGKRILFAIPWGQRVILGTTDTDYDGRPEAVRTEGEDVREILEVVNGAFPTAGISEADVKADWAGIAAADQWRATRRAIGHFAGASDPVGMSGRSRGGWKWRGGS